MRNVRDVFRTHRADVYQSVDFAELERLREAALATLVECMPPGTKITAPFGDHDSVLAELPESVDIPVDEFDDDLPTRPIRPPESTLAPLVPELKEDDFYLDGFMEFMDNVKTSPIPGRGIATWL